MVKILHRGSADWVEEAETAGHAAEQHAEHAQEKEEHFHTHFPCEIIVGHGADKHVYKAMVEDISDGGVKIHCPDIPEEEKRLNLDFRIPEGAMPEEYSHRHVHMDGKIVGHHGADWDIRFPEKLSDKLSHGFWRLLRGSAGLVGLIATAIILQVKYENLYFFWFDVPVFLYSILVGAYLLSRFLFASFYHAPKPNHFEPTVSVIVPVRDEEDHIERTIKQLFESEYPQEKLQVIVVNDHSHDHTLQKVHYLQEQFPQLVLLDLKKSHGKRKALTAGVHVSTGDVVIFVDSDSFLKPDAIRNLMPRLAQYKVAGVTGHCEVENEWVNMLTKMQAVRYYIGYRVMKAAESVFDTVTCLSGPLAAYHRKPLLEVLDRWTSQTYLGKPATFGDDRSLTNLLLQRGYSTQYESKAHTTTYVPEDMKTFLSQQMRWKKSWFRESLVAARFMWKREPLMSLSFYLGFLLPILAPLIVARALVYNPVFYQVSPLNYIGGVFLMSMLLSSTYLFVKRSRLWVYGVHFCFFYMFALVWQVPWAILTSGNNEWGTRGGEMDAGTL